MKLPGPAPALPPRITGRGSAPMLRSGSCRAPLTLRPLHPLSGSSADHYPGPCECVGPTPVTGETPGEPSSDLGRSYFLLSRSTSRQSPEGPVTATSPGPKSGQHTVGGQPMPVGAGDGQKAAFTEGDLGTPGDGPPSSFVLTTHHLLTCQAARPP